MTDREGGAQAVIPFLAIAVLAVPVSSHDCLVAAHKGIQPAHALEHFVQGRIFFVVKPDRFRLVRLLHPANMALML